MSTATLVTAPFCAPRLSGRCAPCRAGETQICDDDYQPGFTGPGSFAQYVALPYAEVNLVPLPESLGFVGRRLGCRFMTAFRGGHRAGPGTRRASGSRCTAAAASGCRR